MGIDPAALPVAIGEVIAGRYAITGVLGSGGMGVVMAGRHIELDERVAIKFLNKEHSAFAERFFREARAAARIRSEHVVRIYDVGRLERGDPYIVMEHLEGTDLAARLQATRRMSPEEVAHILLDVCQALAEAHAVGIVHRDLKPANIFLARGPDGDDLVKLLDFGVAKVPDAGTVTKTSAVLGSPAYMSPEQLMASKDVDARSDIWSLGVILYEMLTGSLPFSAESIIVLAMMIRDKPTPSVRDVRPELPEALDDVVRKCLAKDRSDRFSDVAEFADAIAKFASPALARSSSRIRRVLANAKTRRDSAAALDSTIEAPSSNPIQVEPGVDSGAETVSAGADGRGGVDVGRSLRVSSKASESSPSKASASKSSPSEASQASASSTSSGAMSNASSSASPIAESIASIASSSARESRADEGSSMTSGRRWWLAGIATVGVGTLVGVAWRVVAPPRSPSDVASVPTAMPSVTPSPQPVTSLAAGASSGAPAAPQGSAADAPPSSASASTPSVASVRPAVVAAKPTPTAPRTSASPATPSVATSASVKPTVNCNPPFTIDANGVRRVKPECM